MNRRNQYLNSPLDHLCCYRNSDFLQRTEVVYDFTTMSGTGGSIGLTKWPIYMEYATVRRVDGKIELYCPLSNVGNWLRGRAGLSVKVLQPHATYPQATRSKQQSSTRTKST